MIEFFLCLFLGPFLALLGAFAPYVGIVGAVVAGSMGIGFLFLCRKCFRRSWRLLAVFCALFASFLFFFAYAAATSPIPNLCRNWQ